MRVKVPLKKKKSEIQYCASWNPKPRNRSARETRGEALQFLRTTVASGVLRSKIPVYTFQGYLNGFWGEGCEIKEIKGRRLFFFFFPSLIFSGYNGHCKAKHLQIWLQVFLLCDFSAGVWWAQWEERERGSCLLRRVWFVLHSGQVSRFYLSISMQSFSWCELKRHMLGFSLVLEKSLCPQGAAELYCGGDNFGGCSI